MTKKEHSSDAILKEGALLVYEPEILTLVVASRAESIAIERNLPPSTYLNPSLISMGSHEDSWDVFNFRSSHYLDPHKLTIYSDSKGLELSIDLITYYFRNADGILPVIKCSHPADWPYLFLAQLQRICQKRGIAPSEALVIFGIIYMGDSKDCWSNFNWMSSIHPKHVTVSLDIQGNTYN